MTTATAAANSLQNLIYRAVAWANMADNAASSPATTIDIALHTAAPTNGLQSHNEITVGQWNTYARISVPRNTSNWNAASGGLVSNTNLLQFVEMASGSGATITHISTGIGGNIIHYGALTASRTVAAGIQPQLAAAQLTSLQT